VATGTDRIGEIHFCNFSYQPDSRLRIDTSITWRSIWLALITLQETIGNRALTRDAGKQKQSEREYYEKVIGSHLRRDVRRRLRSSPNQHHVVNDEFKPVDKLKYQQHHNLDHR
jgi:hypothetical protein